MTRDLNYNWVNGEKVTTDEVISVFNPANGNNIGDVPSVSKDTVQEAINSAVSSSKSGLIILLKRDNII